MSGPIAVNNERLAAAARNSMEMSGEQKEKLVHLGHKAQQSSDK